MALSEPGKTRPRKQGPFTTSGQTSKRTSSVSSIQSTHSSSSLPPSAKGHKSKSHNLIGNQISCDKTNVPYSASASSACQSSSSVKSHERSKSDLSAIKLSAESSSVTSLPSLKKGLGNHGQQFGRNLVIKFCVIMACYTQLLILYVYLIFRCKT